MEDNTLVSMAANHQIVPFLKISVILLLRYLLDVIYLIKHNFGEMEGLSDGTNRPLPTVSSQIATLTSLLSTKIFIKGQVYGYIKKEQFPS